MSTKSGSKKRGRKEKPYQLANGQYVNGLRRRKNDGRWVVIATGQMFSEADEAKAIRRFEELTGAIDLAKELEERQQRNRRHNGIGIDWEQVAKDLNARPDWVAKQTGLEKLAYWKSFEKPEKLPNPNEIKRTWINHARCSAEQKSKVARYWEGFVEEAGIKGIDEITPQLAVVYQDFIHSEGYGGKQQSHIFGGIRGILNFARGRAIAVHAIGQALECLRLMKPNESTGNIDPKPISVENWNKLVKAAEGDNKAMVLLMLNSAMYIAEVVRLEWDDLKEGTTLVTRRKKKGEFIRVACLWPETILALKKLEKKGPYIFRSRMGLPLSKFTAFERFRALRTKAEVSDDVTPSHLRDGAYSAAVAANVSLPLCNILAGHSSGMSDNYVLASPEIVKPACDAVRMKYFAR
jgi:integrase